MKTAILTVALMLGTAAVAQDATTPQDTPNQPSGETVDDPSQSTGPEGVTQQGTDPNGMGTAPAGTNQGSMNSQGMSGMAGSAQAGSYPVCSRTVTDRCVQSYERGTRGPRRARARR